MVLLRCFNEELTADKAVRLADKVVLYDSLNKVKHEITGIDSTSWENIELLEGEWTPESEIPDKFDILRADVDFLLMLSGESDEAVL